MTIWVPPPSCSTHEDCAGGPALFSLCPALLLGYGEIHESEVPPELMLDLAVTAWIEAQKEKKERERAEREQFARELAEQKREQAEKRAKAKERRLAARRAKWELLVACERCGRSCKPERPCRRCLPFTDWRELEAQRQRGERRAQRERAALEEWNRRQTRMVTMVDFPFRDGRHVRLSWSDFAAMTKEADDRGLAADVWIAHRLGLDMPKAG